MKTIQIKFRNNPQEYSYIYNLSSPVTIGDLVVVDSPITGRFELVEVSSLNQAVGATKFIAGSVDLTKYKNALETAKQVTTIKKELDKRLKLVADKLKYKMLADMDPTAADLMDQLAKLEE
jgi:hypothetical protein